MKQLPPELVPQRHSMTRSGFITSAREQIDRLAMPGCSDGFYLISVDAADHVTHSTGLSSVADAVRVAAAALNNLRLLAASEGDAVAVARAVVALAAMGMPVPTTIGGVQKVQGE